MPRDENFPTEKERRQNRNFTVSSSLGFSILLVFCGIVANAAVTVYKVEQLENHNHGEIAQIRAELNSLVKSYERDLSELRSRVNFHQSTKDAH